MTNKMKIVLFVGIAALSACQTEGNETHIRQTLGGHYCEAQMPEVTTWDGEWLSEPTGTQVIIMLPPADEMSLAALVDHGAGTIVWARNVPDTLLPQFVSTYVMYGLVGPGGGPSGPPCEFHVVLGDVLAACLVAMGTRYAEAMSLVEDDVTTCSQ